VIWEHLGEFASNSELVSDFVEKNQWLIFQFEPDSDGWTTGSTDPFPIEKMDEECQLDAARIPVSGFAPFKISI